MHRLNVFFLISLLVALAPKSSLAYPNFIGFGYSSCLTCHWNPFGNGPLNPYGRALSANTISGRLFVSDSTTDEELSQRSGFFFDDPANGGIRPSFDYRGLLLRRGGGGEEADSEWINMQTDLNLSYNFGANNQYILSYTVGWLDKREGRGQEQQEDFISREHYFGHRVNRGFGYYIGLMDKVFGIRHPDHNAYSRKQTGLNQNDQAHGVVLHFLKGDFEWGLNGFVGNLLDDNQSTQQKGFSGMGEYKIGEKTVLGYSLLSSTSEFVDQYMNALHVRSGFGKGSSLLAEVGQIEFTAEDAERNRTSRYAFTQGHILMRRGLFLIETIEYFKSDIDSDPFELRFTQGLQWFPVQRIELRAEVQNTRVFNPTRVSDDRWGFLGQVHLWF